MSNRTTAVGTQSGSDVLTAAEYNDAAGGYIGRATTTSDQTGITTIADLTFTTSGTINPTVNTSRLVQISYNLQFDSNANDDVVTIHIYKDGTQTRRCADSCSTLLRLRRTLTSCGRRAVPER